MSLLGIPWAIAAPIGQGIAELIQNWNVDQINAENAEARRRAGNRIDDEFGEPLRNFNFRDPGVLASGFRDTAFEDIGVDLGLDASPFQQLLDLQNFGDFADDITGFQSQQGDLRDTLIKNPLTFGIGQLGLPDPFGGADAIRAQAAAGAANQAQDSLNAAGQFSGALRTGGDPFSSGLFNDALSGIQQQRRNTLTGAEANIQARATGIQGDNALRRQAQISDNRQENRGINAAIASLGDSITSSRGLASNVLANTRGQVTRIGESSIGLAQGEQQIDIQTYDQLIDSFLAAIQRAEFDVGGMEIFNQVTSAIPGIQSTAYPSDIPFESETVFFPRNG